jgi:ribosomal protein S18 acetylase RimI-like enzyme
MLPATVPGTQLQPPCLREAADARRIAPLTMPILEPMRPESFEAFLETSSAAYAHDNVVSGRWRAEEALDLARAENQSLLPNGVETAGHFLFELVPAARAKTVGYLWLSTMHLGAKKVAHVFQLYVIEDHRRRGYGRAALQEAETFARESGHAALTLNVFGSNTAARALYDSMGFEIVTLGLAKALG